MNKPRVNSWHRIGQRKDMPSKQKALKHLRLFGTALPCTQSCILDGYLRCEILASGLQHLVLAAQAC